MRLSVIKCVCEKSPVVSYHRQQINPTSDFANGSKTRTCKRCCIGRHSQNARLERRNASFSDEKIRTATVPGQTLERGKGRNQVAASIKERNCDRQINKIGRDKMMAYLSSFYGTDWRLSGLWCVSPRLTPLLKSRTPDMWSPAPARNVTARSRKATPALRWRGHSAPCNQKTIFPN